MVKDEVLELVLENPLQFFTIFPLAIVIEELILRIIPDFLLRTHLSLFYFFIFLVIWDPIAHILLDQHFKEGFKHVVKFFLPHLLVSSLLSIFYLNYGIIPTYFFHLGWDVFLIGVSYFDFKSKKKDTDKIEQWVEDVKQFIDNFHLCPVCNERFTVFDVCSKCREREGKTCSI